YEAVYLLGECYFQRGDFWKAYERFEQVVESTAGELFYKALRREMDVARAFLAGEKRIVWKVLRLPAYDDGIEILDRVWERAPGTRIGEEALKLKADYFFAVGDMDLAQDEYVALAREHPNGRFVQLAMIRSAEAAAAAFPGIKFDDRALVEAEERYRQVMDLFPAFAEREQAPARLEGIRNQRAEKDLDIAQWYERTGRPDAAAYYYRLVITEYPDTLAANEARVRLRALGEAFSGGEEAVETQRRPSAPATQSAPPEEE
ncbi:MAG: outer membrane protein assembly factor BamD, partial [Planctomycetota bacterium]